MHLYPPMYTEMLQLPLGIFFSKILFSFFYDKLDLDKFKEFVSCNLTFLR